MGGRLLSCSTYRSVTIMSYSERFEDFRQKIINTRDAAKKNELDPIRGFDELLAEFGNNFDPEHSMGDDLSNDPENDT